jgi:FtsP/CotA-like multicopper oxidase with cupredoxin domain
MKHKETNMRADPHHRILALAACLALLAGAPAAAQILIQCPGDVNGDGLFTDYCSQTLVACQNNGDCPGQGNTCIGPEVKPDGVACMHLGGGDGFATMADGKTQYIFSFSDLGGVTDANDDGDISDDVMAAGSLAAAWPAPVIAVDQGDEFYLTLTNVGMLIRPDLFDPHTVHFHGFPNASAVFDGLPESAIAINMGASLTYYYNLVEPGTFMYHCHVEATEHMQMGMLGNLYVRPAQNRLPDGTVLGTWIHSNPDAGAVPDDPLVGDKYAYNDGDGTTRYDVEFPIQLGGFDPEFHDASWFVQPLPFAYMRDRYPMLNGRGYPDTVNPGALPAPSDPECGGPCNDGIQSQVESSLITATAGERILLRLSNLNITVSHTLISPSIPMTVVGIDSRELRSADGTTPLHYDTNSVTLGGGMATDVILDTTGVAAGTYFLYAANLNYLSNDAEDFGGMMTEIVIN